MQNINLIRKIAWSFHKTTGIDYKELFSEACLAYFEALQKFDSSQQSKDTTFAWIVIKSRLIDYIRKNPRRMESLDVVIDWPDHATYQPNFEFMKEFWLKIPEKNKPAVSLILAFLNTLPDEMPPKLARGKLTQILRQKGLSWPCIWESYKLIKIALNQI